MGIAIGSDHRGYGLKQAILELLSELGHHHSDMGCFDDSAVDYPDVAKKVARVVGRGEADKGILICGTGIGMSISANKIPGVRAALCTDIFSARMARQHNDANVLCMGGSILGSWLAKEITRTFLTCQFEGGRHARRVDKIASLEQQGQTTTTIKKQPKPTKHS